MAIGRLSIKSGSKGKALAHAKYILREDKYAKQIEKKGEKLEFIGHGNMPAWAKDNPNFFWQISDEMERQNGSVYREHIITLPRELNEIQRHELIKDWIENEIGDQHPYSYAIHNPQSMDGGEQPHCHLMFCERTLDGIERQPDQFFKRYNAKYPENGGAKKANTGLDYATRKQQIKDLRDRWEKTCNRHLLKVSKFLQISMKSLKDRGIDRLATNISMAEMNKPEVKQAYKDHLQARHTFMQSFKAVRQNINVKAELDKAPTQPPTPQKMVQPIKQETQHERTTQDTRAEQRQIHQAPTSDRATASGIDSLQQGGGGVFSKGISGTSQSEKQQIIIETHRKPVKMLLNSKVIDTTQQVEKSLEMQNKPSSKEIRHEQPTQDTSASYHTIHQAPTSDRATASGIDSLQQSRGRVFQENTSGTSQSEKQQIVIETHRKPSTKLPEKTPQQLQVERMVTLKQAQHTIDQWEELLSHTVEAMKSATITKRTNTEEEASEKLSNHLAKKPKYLGLTKWETTKTELEAAKKQAEISLAKATGDIPYHLRHIKIEPIDYEKYAIAQLEQEPATKAKHEASEKAKEIVQRILEQVANEKAQQHGADIYAKQGVNYHGKVLRADENGILQQTSEGVVYHPPLSSVEEGKNYNLKATSSTMYDIQESIKIKINQKSQEQNIQR